MLRSLVLSSVLYLSDGFHSQHSHSRTIVHSTNPIFQASPLFSTRPDNRRGNLEQRRQNPSLLKRIITRFDTIESAGLEDVRIAGIVSKIHGPITYLALGLMAGIRWKWCFRNPYYWFAMAFCVKWYRARYVFKIPVWDRQPNWNNIITSREQEKDLKAFTCKNCGSTLFIAKTREFFFEGSTGIGGLGCFTCGKKGAENFIMDRERIVDDVADMDDYFEYERPLDFVTAAERRKVLKEAGGDEEKANELLLEKATVDGSSTETAPEGETLDTEVEEGAVNGDNDSKGAEPLPEDDDSEEKTEPVAEIKVEEKTDDSSTKKAGKKEQPPRDEDEFELDDLGMDDF